MDIVGLYPRVLETRDNKQIPSDTLAERVEVVLKNNIWILTKRISIAKGMKFAPPYAILFMADFEEKC